ncbi:uncharacterized protein LOC108195853 [Daucus carota subsp. sativus]|uniref:uncharacterized protein LOC108195853 n=1 Tax=Daucus carota subsp. sativus TaxID=79200 RepID=UPI0007EF76C9|nr:PREDICTED: uncharacterized protein LOC108195853 isoform X2 [Daucus carota subsp. sativus]
MKLLPEGVTSLINIKHLVLTVLPFQDKDMLSWLTYILKAAPLLTNLQLNQFHSRLSRRSEPDDILLPEVTHVNLTKLEINGYQGEEHEKVLLKYLVDSAVKLDLLVISPRMKLYSGLNDWRYINSNTSDNRVSLEQLQELHSIVPKAVRVKYCD